MPIVSLGHGAVQQTTRLVHLDCDCTASASVPDVDRAEGIAESRLCRRSSNVTARTRFHVKPRDQQGRRYAERSGSLQQPGTRADRSEVMKGVAGLPIDPMCGRSGVDASDTGGHRCRARSSGFIGGYRNLRGLRHPSPPTRQGVLAGSATPYQGRRGRERRSSSTTSNAPRGTVASSRVWSRGCHT